MGSRETQGAKLRVVGAGAFDDAVQEFLLEEVRPVRPREPRLAERLEGVAPEGVVPLDTDRGEGPHVVREPVHGAEMVVDVMDLLDREHGVIFGHANGCAGTSSCHKELPVSVGSRPRRTVGVIMV